MLTSEWLVLNRPSVAGFHSPGDSVEEQRAFAVQDVVQHLRNLTKTNYGDNAEDWMRHLKPAPSDTE